MTTQTRLNRRTSAGNKAPRRRWVDTPAVALMLLTALFAADKKVGVLPGEAGLAGAALCISHQARTFVATSFGSGLLNFRVCRYRERGTGARDNLLELVDDLGTELTKDRAGGMQQQRCCISMDNGFASPDLFLKLLEKDVRAIGVIKERGTRFNPTEYSPLPHGDQAPIVPTDPRVIPAQRMFTGYLPMADGKFLGQMEVRVAVQDASDDNPLTEIAIRDKATSFDKKKHTSIIRVITTAGSREFIEEHANQLCYTRHTLVGVGPDTHLHYGDISGDADSEDAPPGELNSTVRVCASVGSMRSPDTVQCSKAEAEADTDTDSDETVPSDDEVSDEAYYESQEHEGTTLYEELLSEVEVPSWYTMPPPLVPVACIPSPNGQPVNAFVKRLSLAQVRCRRSHVNGNS